jgi:hypothetical protein
VWWRINLRKLAPYWPRSLYQSLENPVQADRLPDTSGVELDYPTFRHTLAQNLRHMALIVFISAAVSSLPYCMSLLLPMVEGPYGYYWSLTVAAGFWVLIGLLERKKPIWRWAVYGATAITLATIYSVRCPFFPYAAAIALAIPVSDVFATHYLHLKTAAPTPRARALGLRELWANRLRFFGAHPRGAELHKLSLAAIPVVLLSTLFLAFQTAEYSWAAIAALALAPLLLIASRLAVEALAAWLYRRPYVSPALMLRSFADALLQWFSYNRHGATGPGVFQTPAGRYQERRAMGLGVFILFTTSASMLITAKPRPAADVHGFLARANPEPPRLTSAPAPERSAKTAPKAEPKLEKYQERMLERMNPAQREEYLKKLKDKQQAAAREQEPASPPKLPPPLAKILFSFVNVVARVYSAAHIPVLSALLGGALFLSSTFAASASAAGFYTKQLGATSTERLFDLQNWDMLVGRIQSSADEQEKRSLMLGVNAFDDTPVIVPREVFQEHAHILGDSGSGKTSLGIASLITQFIRFRDSSIVIIDLKGDDLALFEGARLEANEAAQAVKRGQPNDPDAGYGFRWFTNELGRPTYVFNPLRQRHFPTLSLYQRTDILTAAMGLRYGTDYGRAYFADANAEMLCALCRRRKTLDCPGSRGIPEG